LTTDLPKHGLAKKRTSARFVLVHEGGKGCTVEFHDTWRGQTIAVSSPLLANQIRQIAKDENCPRPPIVAAASPEGISTEG